MEMRWNTFGFWLQSYIYLISIWEIRECWSLNEEGLALLEFRAKITLDPSNALANWSPYDRDPCKWLGVRCVDGKVQMLELNGLSLEGTLAPELGKLSHLKSLVLCKNKFSGPVPKELGDLVKLELLDLRENYLTGSIPPEVDKMLLLKHLLLSDNNIEGSDVHDPRKFSLPSKLTLVENCSSPLGTLFACINRKFGYCAWQSNFKQWNEPDSLMVPMKAVVMKYFNALTLPLLKLGKPTLFYHEENYCDLLPSSDKAEIGLDVPNFVSFPRRKLLEQSNNLAAAPFSGEPTIEFSSVPISVSSGAFPATPNANMKQNQPPSSLLSPPNSPHDSSDANQTSQALSSNGSSRKLWKYIAFVILVTVATIVIILYTLRKRAAKVIIKPWKTGISGQLQKAFITGVPKLNRGELETACEDFSNIIIAYEGCTIYKGTLSNGVEIGVVSTIIRSPQEWSKSMEINYRKKIDTLSRINHKNFINLIGYCEEENPFTRMLVFEYAPNGNLFEQLHVKELERLKWSERMRIIMGIAYCLQYMHHELNPPLSHNDLTSNMVFLTDDFAAKVAEVTFRNVASQDKIITSEGLDFEKNVYDFGMLMLEIISGKLPNSEEQDNLVKLVDDCLNERKNMSYMIDPTLQSVKDKELEVVCEVIQECIKSDSKLRPKMRDVASKLREGLGMSPEQTVPRLSPLWWAELEILSVEAT